MILRNASLFSQLLALIPRDKFDTLVAQTKAEARSKGFSSWDQFVAMLTAGVKRLQTEDAKVERLSVER